MTTTAGSLALEGSIPPVDSFVARRLRDAGAVLLGKTNLSEWANFRSTRSVSGWSGRGGLGRNPYALDRNTSGSSSGTAAGDRRELRGRRHRHRDRRLHRLAGQQLRPGRDQADGRPRQPDWDHPHRPQPGHRRPDGSHGGRRSHTARGHCRHRPRRHGDARRRVPRADATTRSSCDPNGLKGARIGVPREGALRPEPARRPPGGGRHRRDARGGRRHRRSGRHRDGRQGRRRGVRGAALRVQGRSERLPRRPRPQGPGEVARGADRLQRPSRAIGRCPGSARRSS